LLVAALSPDDPRRCVSPEVAPFEESDTVEPGAFFFAPSTAGGAEDVACADVVATPAVGTPPPVPVVVMEAGPSLTTGNPPRDGLSGPTTQAKAATPMSSADTPKAATTSHRAARSLRLSPFVLVISVTVTTR
jgi:hypothetical protein